MASSPVHTFSVVGAGKDRALVRNRADRRGVDARRSARSRRRVAATPPGAYRSRARHGSRRRDRVGPPPRSSPAEPSCATRRACTGSACWPPHQRVGSVHPLVSLPDPTIGAARLAGGAVFAVAGDPITVEVATALGGRPIDVPDEARARYHATAAVAANHLVVLCGQVERLAASVGVPVEAYWELMATTLANVRSAGAVSSLTGSGGARRHLHARGPHSLAPGGRTCALHHACQARSAACRRRPRGRPRCRLSERPPATGEPADGPTRGPAPTTIETIAELRASLDAHRGAGRTIGFVPTMGYLHEGHASLIEASAAHDDVTVVSIFVNPLQFAPTEDLDAYPRDLERDTAIAGDAGAAVRSRPRPRRCTRPGRCSPACRSPELSAAWDGASRPTHFAGVATVVAKLFNIVGACRAYFGEKDFQQLTIIRRMVDDLSVPVEVIGCPIVREHRRARHVEPQRLPRPCPAGGGGGAPAGARRRRSGDRHRRARPGRRRRRDGRRRGGRTLAELDYAAAVDPATLTQPERLGASARLLIAARVGSTRLIDNSGVTIDAGPNDPPAGGTT